MKQLWADCVTTTRVVVVEAESEEEAEEKLADGYFKVLAEERVEANPWERIQHADFVRLLPRRWRGTVWPEPSGPGPPRGR